jgi:hypothetical protein
MAAGVGWPAPPRIPTGATGARLRTTRDGWGYIMGVCRVEIGAGLSPD